MKQLIGLACSLLLPTALALGADAEMLAKRLKDADPEVRRNAAKDLGELGKDAKPAVPALVAALKDKDLFVRRFAAQSLGAVGADAGKDAISALVSALGDQKPEVGTAAAVALARMGEPGVTTLADIAKDKKKGLELRRKAGDALGKAGTDAKPALPVLTDLLQDRDMRLTAINTLAELGPNAKDQAVVDALKKLLEEKDRNLRMAVQTAMQRINGRVK